MNLDRIKSVSDDGDAYIIDHQDMPSFRMAKAILRPEEKEAFEKMCSGGSVNMALGGDPAKAADDVDANVPVKHYDSNPTDLPQQPTADEPASTQEAAPAEHPVDADSETRISRIRELENGEKTDATKAELHQLYLNEAAHTTDDAERNFALQGADLYAPPKAPVVPASVAVPASTGPKHSVRVDNDGTVHVTPAAPPPEPEPAPAPDVAGAPAPPLSTQSPAYAGVPQPPQGTPPNVSGLPVVHWATGDAADAAADAAADLVREQGGTEDQAMSASRDVRINFNPQTPAAEAAANAAANAAADAAADLVREQGGTEDQAMAAADNARTNFSHQPPAAPTAPNTTDQTTQVTSKNPWGIPSLKFPGVNTAVPGLEGVGEANTYPKLIDRSIGLQEQGANLANAYKAQISDAQAQLATSAQNITERYNGELENKLSDFDREREAHRQAAEANPDPSRVFRQSGWTNTAALLGLAAGTFGSILTKTPNYALQIFNHAIDTDMQAQELQQRKNLELLRLDPTQRQGIIESNAVQKQAALDHVYYALQKKIAQTQPGLNNAALEQMKGQLEGSWIQKRQEIAKNAVDLQYYPYFAHMAARGQELDYKSKLLQTYNIYNAAGIPLDPDFKAALHEVGFNPPDVKPGQGGINGGAFHGLDKARILLNPEERDKRRISVPNFSYDSKGEPQRTVDPQSGVEVPALSNEDGFVQEPTERKEVQNYFTAVRNANTALAAHTALQDKGVLNGAFPEEQKKDALLRSDFARNAALVLSGGAGGAVGVDAEKAWQEAFPGISLDLAWAGGRQVSNAIYHQFDAALANYKQQHLLQ